MAPCAFLLAQAAPPTPSAGQPVWLMFATWGLIGLAFYLLVMVPSRRQEKQRKALIGALKRNDRILNSGGIIGIVESVKDQEDEVVLRGGLRITKSSIVKVYTDEEGARDKPGTA